MKKLSKKQKLIILISIITIIAIIGIIIGANIIRTNIANGNYNSSNGSSNNGNLLPEYIKEGITLGGVTGTLKDLDTSDLAVGGSGFWGSLGAGNYNIPTETNLKQYYIKDENYSNDFGEGRENTATMIAEWNKGENGKYGQQNTGAYDDIWVANNSLGSITASVVYNSYFVRLATTF